jgi:hypothetical protein
MEQSPHGAEHNAHNRDSPSPPDETRAILPSGTARAWKELTSLLPDALYLGGGTAVAVRLRHRESRDLDFFYHNNAVDLRGLARQLGETHAFAVTHESEGTLRGLFGGTKVEFIHADEGGAQHLLEEPETIDGMRVAGLKDLIAMKLGAVAGRGELRDYYDLKTIEERAGLTIEDGIALFAERYSVRPGHKMIQHVVVALGYLDDAPHDDSLPIGKDELADWWRLRQVRLVRHLSRNPI